MGLAAPAVYQQFQAVEKGQSTLLRKFALLCELSDHINAEVLCVCLSGAPCISNFLANLVLSEIKNGWITSRFCFVFNYCRSAEPGGD